MTHSHQPESIFLTEAEYLQSELTSEVKREYIDGQVYAMSGVTRNHNIISGNIARKFGNHLKGTLCDTFMADIKVKIGNNYFYPDVQVDSNKMPGDAYFLTAPMIIVVVLSRSTRKTDATVKLVSYLQLPSLQEYVLIEQAFVSVQVLRKSNHWLPSYYFLGDSVTFESIDLTLTLEEIYDRVDNRGMNEFRQPMLLPAK